MREGDKRGERERERETERERERKKEVYLRAAVAARKQAACLSTILCD